MSTVYAGDIIQSSDNNNLETRIATLEAKGYISSAVDTTSNNSTTTSEVVSSSITFTATATARYLVTFMGISESTVAGDIATVRLRWQNSASSGTGGTSFATANKTAIAAAKGDGFVLIGDFSGQLAGSVTISATIVRNSGSGTVKQNLASAGQSGYFLVQSI
jgi:hypothetical protein